jgi:hypothetical protein
MIKKRYIGGLLFLALLTVAYFLIRDGREKDFRLLANGVPTRMVYPFGTAEIGQYVSVQFTFFQKDRVPITLKEANLGLDTEYHWEQRPTLNVEADTHTFSIRYQPTRVGIEKTEIILKTDKGEFLIDMSGVGKAPRLYVRTLTINDQVVGISLPNRTLYFPSLDIPKTVTLDYELSEAGTLYIANREVVSGTPITFTGTFKEPMPITFRFDTGETITYAIQTTNFPIVILDSEQLSFTNKRAAVFSYLSPEKTVLDQSASLRIRGDTSKGYIKTPFKLNLLAKKRKKKSVEKKISLAGLRKDGDWILNPSYIDKSFIRDRLANDLYAILANPEKVVDSAFIEVIWNNSYQGLYTLNERIDKQQLKLDPLTGRLIKSRGWQKEKGAFEFGFIERTPHRDGYYLKFPKVRSMPKDVSAFLDFCLHAKDEDFKRDIHLWMDLDKVMTYHIWSLATAMTDSGHKNYFIAKRNAQDKFFFVPWDSDVSFGMLPSRERTTPEQLPTLNHILSRIWELNPNGYRDKFHLQWQTLRKGPLQDHFFHERIDAYASLMDKANATKRNFEVVKYQDVSDGYAAYLDDIAYMKTWISAHLSYVDRWLLQ